MSDALFEKQDIENIASVGGPELGTSFNVAAAEAGVDLSFAFSLKTPSQCGFYIPEIAWYTGSGSQTLKWYMSERVTGKEKVEDYIGDHNQIMIKTGLSAGTYEDKSSYESKQYPSLYSDVALYLQPNKEIISAFASAKKNYRFRSITLIPVLDADLKAVVDKNVLDLTDNKETSVSVTVSGTGVDDIPVSENFVEYKSSDESVAKVSASGEITAVDGGKTKIYAQSPDGLVKSNESENTENFADVNASDYFAKELAVARNTGIVGGIGDNKYAPRNNITRQDMMVIVYRALEKMGKISVEEDIILPQNPDFAAVSDYAKEAVSALISASLVNGKNGNIAPLDYTTRAEVAVLIKRILGYVK